MIYTAKKLLTFLDDIFICSSFDEINSNDSLQIDKRDECKNILNNIGMVMKQPG